MCIYDIRVRCESGFAEVVPDEPEKTELTIEDVMCHVLLKLFDGGMVEEVKLRLLSGALVKQRGYSIQIRVLCPCQHFSLSPRTEKNMSGEMQKNTYGVLKELFTSVVIASVTRVAAPWQTDECYVY
ncbi:MAG TPA: hypothetical protein VGD98_22915 [Ktedonobacteraceae bacterium]